MENKNQNDPNPKPDPTSGVARNEAYVRVYRETRDHRAAVRAYCGNNKWAIENAKATGNW